MGADIMPLLAQFANVGSLRGAIVTSEDEQGVICKAIFFQSVHDDTHSGVGLHDEVGMGVQAAFALPFFSGHNRGVW